MPHLFELLQHNEELFKQVSRYKILEKLVQQLIWDLKKTNQKLPESLKKIEDWLKK